MIKYVLPAILSVGMLLVSCTDDYASSAAAGDALVKFTLADGGEASRTVYGNMDYMGRLPVHWADGDKICIYSPQAPASGNETTATLTAGATSVPNSTLRWHATDNVEHHFFCLYPQSRRVAVSASGYTVELPENMNLTVTKGESGRDFTAENMEYAIMTGHTVAPYKSESVALRFTQAVTALQIEVTPPASGSVMVDALTVESADGTTPVAGLVRFDADAVAGREAECFAAGRVSPRLHITLSEPVCLMPGRSLKVTAFVLPQARPVNMKVTVYPRTDAALARSQSVTTEIQASSLVQLGFNRVKTVAMPADGGGYADWQANVNNLTYVADMSLMGTHDAGAIGGYSSSSTSAVTQTLTLREQLDAGYRVLDLRMRWDSKTSTYKIAHESTLFGDYNEDGLRHVDEWLAEHPTEGVIIRTRNEGEQSGWGDNFVSYFTSSHVADRLLRDFDPEMTMGDWRGRVVVISTDDYSGTKVGAKVSWGNATVLGSQPFQTSSGERGWVFFTDRYRGSTSISVPNESDKKSDIQAIFDSAKDTHSQGITGRWHWTWLNVAGMGLTSPGKGTEKYNNYVTDYVNSLPADTYLPVGMVMCDWAERTQSGADRCRQAVTDNNFRASAAGEWPMRRR